MSLFPLQVKFYMIFFDKIIVFSRKCELFSVVVCIKCLTVQKLSQRKDQQHPVCAIQIFRKTNPIVFRNVSRHSKIIINEWHRMHRTINRTVIRFLFLLLLKFFFRTHLLLNGWWQRLVLCYYLYSCCIL